MRMKKRFISIDRKDHSIETVLLVMHIDNVNLSLNIIKAYIGYSVSIYEKALM